MLKVQNVDLPISKTKITIKYLKGVSNFENKRQYYRFSKKSLDNLLTTELKQQLNQSFISLLPDYV